MRVLLAENDPVDRHRLSRLMSRWNLDVLECEEGDEAWQVLAGDDAPRLVVLDWMMPGLSGLEICRRVREREDKVYTYIVLVTGRQDAADVEMGLEAGADDYLFKPVQPQELRARLRAGRRILTLQEGLIDAERKLRERAERDDLTGLLNRGTILNLLEREMARARRERQPLGIAIGDLDRFKRVNDTLGHQAGDAVLVEAAERMKNLLRGYDAIGRLGGEEFLVVLPRTDLQGVVGVAERLRESVGESAIELSPQGECEVTITFGVAAVRPAQRLKLEQLIRIADRALYSGKLAGRNCVMVGSPDQAGAQR